MISDILSKLFGTANERAVQRLQPLVDTINRLEDSVKHLTDEQLAAKTNEFREQLAQGKHIDDIMPHAYAVAREVAKRTLGMRPFDVQVMGAIVLHQGKVSEMKTGEGKTLTATMPLYLNSLTGKGSHLVTVNDYLAQRDSAWNKPMYDGLGVSVAVLTHAMSDAQRKEAYNSDILYATNNELGFDYLRDNMKFRYEDYVQRELNYGIIDECDSILIDEARTPLIISGAAQRSSDLYVVCQQAVDGLVRTTHYEFDEKARSVQLTEEGTDLVESRLRIENLYAIENINVLHHVMQALKANVVFKRDVDYVVRDGEVLIVDEFTGRILSGRRYSDGLHQAIEAKEGVDIEQETQTLASITLQNFFRMYKKLAGMTGSAMTEAEELMNIYGLDVVSLPTNRPLVRQDKDDVIFLSERSKFNAIVEDVKGRHAKGQPVLIGTVAVETSEKLSSVLTASGIPHEVLNAKNHAREAEIIAKAGQAGHVTIATNMAGRGTDIKLSPEGLAAGGLYVLGTERHESRRIDNQLRGRSGRQGDAGESRFYISLDDNLIRIFSGDSMKRYMQRAGMKEDEQIESRTISRLIERSQEKVEKHNFEIRKHLIEYDDVLNQHRKVIYQMRQNLLAQADDIASLAKEFIVTVVENIVAFHCPNREVSVTSFEEVLKALSSIVHIPVEKLKEIPASGQSVESLQNDLSNFLCMEYDLYGQKSEDKEQIQNAQKWVMLETIDQAWKQHMLNIDHLKEGIGLRGWGQKNPLIEYKKEAFAMFEDMMKQIQAEIVFHIFKLKPELFNAQALEAKREEEMRMMRMSGPTEEGTASVESSQASVREEPKIGRNDDCPCGSGKKYKKCCGV